MTTVIAADSALFASARTHLSGQIEQVGFFLADFDGIRDAFVLREWRPMPPEAFEFQSSYHVALRDEMRPEIIKWAWDAGAALVEAHSHGDEGTAEFSPSDLYGFTEWVPHVRWRLRGRPYAAIVTAGDTFDALGWLGDATAPTQISSLETEGVSQHATGRTLTRLAELREYSSGR